MNARTVLALIVLGGVLAGCKSSSNLNCSFDDPPMMPTSGWPKFRRDLQNTGTVVDAAVFAAVANNGGQKAAVFPPLDQPAKGPFSASPAIINATDGTGDWIYIGSADGTLYRLMAANLSQDTTFIFSILSPITSTALLTHRSTTDAIFVGAGDGHLYALDGTAMPQPSAWPVSLSGFVSASPTLNATDGTVYAGSLSGLFLGTCPNGVERFGISVDAVRSSAAVGPDGAVYFGAVDNQLRAVAADGTFQWAFSASAPIVSAPVVEVDSGTTVAIYVADRGGRLFKVKPNGQPADGFDFAGNNGGPVDPIASSPALAKDHLYFGSDDGNLYAVNTTSGAIDWSCTAGQCRPGRPMADTGAPITSSPAVASDPESPQRVVVVGSNDGNVYFLTDNGTSAARTRASPVSIGAPVGSSPAINTDGTVYVGADDGRVYAIK